MTEASIGHYEIKRRLGAGGMGEVFLARDTWLERDVAIKKLSEAVCRDAVARERLVREARAASKLNHPNIVTIYAIELVDGCDAIVMEYIDGVSLDQYRAQPGRTLGELLNVSLQIAEGIAVAHAAGVVHRDLKPSNVLIDRTDRARILDFGLAISGTDVRLTRDGALVGSPAYMSPEQARGEKNLDSRSDLFSLGCVIYEMAVGRRPFEGEHLTAVLYELLSENPPKPSSLRPDLPDGFDDFISATLAKDRESRYQSADDVATALQGIGRDDVRTFVPPTVGQTQRKPVPFTTRMKFGIGLSLLAIIAVVVVGYLTFNRYFEFVKHGSSSKLKMLAVLPFQNLGGSDQEYFSDGLTEEVITRLGSVQELNVISRTSVMRYKRTNKTAHDIASELGVDYLMEGSVQWAPSREGDRLRVTARLISANDETQLWSQTYDRQMSDVFAIQTEISQQVTGALEITLVQADQDRVTRGGTTNTDALLAYYRGNSHFNQGHDSTATKAAIEAYQTAVSIDSNYAQAWARLSRAHASMVHWGLDRQTDHRKPAKRAMEIAMRLQPNSPDVHLAAGYYSYWVEKDYPKASEQFTSIQNSGIKSAELFEAYTALAYVLRRQGRFEEALAHLQIALTQDPDVKVKDAAPRFAVRAWEVGNTYMRLRRWVEAERYLIEAIRLSPDETPPYCYLARVQIYGHANPDSADKIMSKYEGHEKSGEFVEDRVWIDILRRDPAAARQHLSIGSMDTVFYFLQGATVAELEGREELARAMYDSAAVNLQAQVKGEPDLAVLHRFLGIAYAGLGRKDEALREGRRALALQPPKKEPFAYGPGNLEGMARICARVGDADEAVRLLDSLLSLPAGLLTPEYLKIAPEYDALRGNPQFEVLLSAGQPTAMLEP